MPIISGLTDPLLVKLFHTGSTDKEIAEEYGISVQAVSKRRMKLGLIRKPVSRQVNDGLSWRWERIWSPKEGTGHHNAYSAKALKVWLRMRLGDTSLSAKQQELARQWENKIRASNQVLCYDPDTPEGWFYRPRKPEDGRRVIDWPKHLPYPSEGFKKALDLPPEVVKEAV
ncbi:hypothetical protein AB0D68_10950 [Streptomyces sp. NPDC048212]|uniref:hypothetical protein n=1 Tax=Streptomyces sp. NPDC048212 TaxID=3156658 RepID=UPI0033F2AFEE